MRVLASALAEVLDQAGAILVNLVRAESCILMCRMMLRESRRFPNNLRSTKIKLLKIARRKLLDTTNSMGP